MSPFPRLADANIVPQTQASSRQSQENTDCRESNLTVLETYSYNVISWEQIE